MSHAKRPSLTLAEQCAENGLVLSSTRSAQVSGVVGKVFAGDGQTHRCARPSGQQQQCEMVGQAQSAVVKKTSSGSPEQILHRANQLRWHHYNSCMAEHRRRAPAAPAPAPAQPTTTPPADPAAAFPAPTTTQPPPAAAPRATASPMPSAPRSSSPPLAPTIEKPAHRKTTSFEISGLIGVPLGQFANGMNAGIGVLLGLSYAKTPRTAITARVGAMEFDAADGSGSLSNVPVWGGVRYRLSNNPRGLYLHGEAGFNRLKATVVGLGSASETELGVGFGVGAQLGRLTLDGALHVLSLEEAGDSMMLGLAAGATF